MKIFSVLGSPKCAEDFLSNYANAEADLNLSLAYMSGAKFSDVVAHTVELRWLEPLWDHVILFETAVVRASEGYY